MPIEKVAKFVTEAKEGKDWAQACVAALASVVEFVKKRSHRRNASPRPHKHRRFCKIKRQPPPPHSFGLVGYYDGEHAASA
jgi:hypothetical protein